MSTPPPLFVCIYVPEFPAQALLRHRTALARSPVAVIEGVAPFESVCSVSTVAARLGVHTGMTRAELDSFTGLTILRRSEAEERTARAALLEAAGVFTPRVEVQTKPAAKVQPKHAIVHTNAFSLVLDMAGTHRLFGEATEALQRIAASLKALCFYAQLAAGANQHAALCMAPAARTQPILIAPGREREQIAPLPLAALGLTSHQAETLELWGLRTCGELAALPEIDLISRLGQQGKRLRLLARGEHAHLLVPEEPAFALEEFLEFDAPVELLDSLLFVIGPMLDQIILRAQNRAYALASLTVKLGLEGGGEHERTLKPALPVAQREVLLKLLHLDLQAHPPPAAILTLLLHAEPGDRSKVQLGLYAPQLPEAMRLDVTLARIAAVVGEGRVGRARLLDTHRPEAFTVERFTVPSTAADAARSTVVAVRRCRPPLPLRLQRQGARPAAFHLRDLRYTVEQAFGPWRKSGQWWTGEVWSYEEWDVCGRTADGSRLLCIVVHDLLRDQWQMEALYD